MHTGYRSIQSGKIYHRDFLSNLAKLHTSIFFGGGGGCLGEEHLRTTPAKGILTVQTANSQRSKNINQQATLCVCVCVCVCAFTVFSSRVFCPFYQCEHPLSTCVHSYLSSFGFENKGNFPAPAASSPTTPTKLQYPLHFKTGDKKAKITTCQPLINYNWLYAQLHYFLNFRQLLCFLSAIIGQTD